MIGMSLLAPQRTTTINMAGTTAEAAASSAARGQRIKCNRGLGWMTLRECVGRFLAGQEDQNDQNNPCARDLGCSAGRVRVNMLQEDGEMGKSNYGACVECGRKGNRDSAGRCYLEACKKDRGKKPTLAQESAPATIPAPADGLDLVDDLTLKESPILDAKEVAAGRAMASQVSPQDVTCHDPAAEAAARLEAASGIHRLHWLYPDQYDPSGHPIQPQAQSQDGAA